LNTTLQAMRSAWSIKKNLRTLFVRENDRWAFLDGYKAIGIFWVILGHSFSSTQNYLGMERWADVISSGPIYLQWIFNGDVAVDGFFMISAFLMGNILMKQHQSAGKMTVKLFYFSRFLRLTPAYFLALILYSLIPSNQTDLIWPNFFYIQNFFNDYDRYFLPLTWSLAVEEQFYLLLPMYLIFILLKTKHPFIHLLSLLLASFLIRAWIIFDDDMLRSESIKGIIFHSNNFGHYFVTLYDNLYTRIGAFIPGLAVAYLYRYKSEQSKNFMATKAAGIFTIIAMLCALSLCLMPVLMKGFELPQWVNITLNIARSTVVCLCAAWLLFCGLFATQHARRFNKSMSVKFFYPFGHLLYCMYLFHYVGVTIAFVILVSFLQILQIDYMAHFFAWVILGAALGIIISMLIAIVIFLAIEAPLMNLRPKYHG
jgi:peptidoglycan/LPS O-acetylase OafA/YrhL